MRHCKHNRKGFVYKCAGRAFIALLMSGIASNVAFAQDATLFRDNLKARQYLSKMANVYKGMKSYSGSVKLLGQVTGQSQMPVIQAVVSLQKPHFAAMRFTDSSDTNFAVFDGTTLFATSSRYKNQYVRQFLSKRLGVMRVLTRAGMTGPGLTLLFDHPDMMEAFAPLSSLSLGQPISLSGVPVVTVVSRTQQGQNKLVLTYYIGKKDLLLHQMTLVQTINGQTVTMTETHTNIQTNIKLSTSTFTFIPPPGAKRVKTFASPS